MRCAVVELCLTQRANPNLQGSKPKSCATRSARRHCTQCRPRKGGTGIPVAGLPAEPYPSRRSGLDYLGSNSCTFLLRKIIIYNSLNNDKYLKLLFFFFTYNTYLQTVPVRCLIVNLDKFASCSFVHGCSARIEIKFGMGMCQFGMEHFA